MAMNYTPIPNEFLEEMGDLSDAEYGRLIRWCQTYITTGECMELRGNERLFMRRCKMQMDRYKGHYDDISQKRAESGKSGGEANASKRKQTLPNGSKSKQTVPNGSNCKETKTDTNTETNTNSPANAGEKRARAFVPPTLEEVRAYCRQRNSSVDPDRFFEYFDAGGWVDSKGQKVRSWKQKLITWESKGGGQHAGNRGDTGETGWKLGGIVLE